MIYSVWIINKAGGLIYHQSIGHFHPALTSNDLLILASTFQSVHSISCGIQMRNSGISCVVCPSDPRPFKLLCLASPTGLKFLMTCDPAQAGCDDILQKVYTDYCEWVLKNPVYTPEMPIRIAAFDKSLSWITSK